MGSTGFDLVIQQWSFPNEADDKFALIFFAEYWYYPADNPIKNSD